MNADKIAVEARARIIWGEPASSVRAYLISNGVPNLEADAKVMEFQSERTRELRRMALRNMLIGIVLTSAATGTLYLSMPIASGASGMIKVLAVALLAGLYGLSKLAKGVVCFVRPQSDQRSIPDANDSDLIQ